MKNKSYLFVIIFSLLMSFDGDKHDYYLPNGLKVIIYEKHTHPTIALNVVYDIGSHDDPMGKKGLANVMKNIMLEGSNNYAKGEHRSIVSSTGGETSTTPWWLNDYIEFANISTSDHLELLLKLEADRMSSPLINPESVKNAKDDALSTLKEEMESSFWEVGKAVNAMYPDKHPYLYHFLGNVDDIKTISVDDCQNTFDKYFTPNNAVLVIVGDVDPLESFNLVTKYFGLIKSSEDLPNNPSLTLAVKGNTKLNIFDVNNWPMASYVEAYSLPGPQNKDSIVLAFIHSVLSMRSSPYKKIISSNDIFIDGFIYYNQKLGNVIMAFVLESKPSTNNYKPHTKNIKKYIKQLKKNGVEESLLKITIKKEKRNYYNRNNSIYYTAQSLARREIIYGDYKTYFDTAQLYEGITNEDIKRVAKKYLINDYKLALQPKQ